MEQHMVPYIKDVAREAGVSAATVSRVLGGSGYPVSAETRERVLAAAARLRYQPNGLGRSLRLGRASSIGMCAATLDNPTAVAAVEGVIQACRARNRRVQTSTTFFDPREEQSDLELFLQERLLGVISFPCGAPAESYLRLQQSGAPVVLLNRRVPGLAAPLVRHDFAGGYAMIVRRLVERGHRRIGAILPVDTGASADYTQAWEAAFAVLGLEPMSALVRQVRPSPHTEETDRAVRDLLSSAAPPTALFTATAVATLIAIRLVRSPDPAERQSIELVGTGDERWELLFPPEVGFLCLDSFGLGRTAAEILNDLIDGGRDVRSDVEAVIGARFVEATA